MKNNVDKQALLAYEYYAINHPTSTKDQCKSITVLDCNFFSYILQVASEVGQLPRIHMLIMK